ncbi:hypothetical protein KSS87_001100 [Heliosperma pusillum]|nr:hypothetical protein KSS87_001100 [Heliosperma pusillum]
MYLTRVLQTRTRLLHRHLTQSATAAIEAILPADPETRLTYLDGFPRPQPAETINAIPRAESGSTISVRERKAGRIPGILFEQKDGQYGGNKRLISVQGSQIKKLVNAFGHSYFLSRLFYLQVKPQFDSDDIIEQVRVLPRLIHLHPSSDAVINVTFIRAPPSALLKVDVPLKFRGEDISPGLRKGAYLNIIKRTVKYLCPADIIPPYIDVDISEMDAGAKLVTGDLKVHPALKLIPSKDEPIVKIMGARIAAEPKKK